MNILICNEKNTDANPFVGISNSFHNLILTAHQYFSKDTIHTLHLDESFEVYKTHIDKILPEYCQKYDIKIIFFMLLGEYVGNPTNECYKKLKDMGIYLVFMFPDSGANYGFGTIKQLGDIPNLTLSWDNPKSEFHSKLDVKPNHLFLFVPQDKTLYFDDIKTIDVSFIGSLRGFGDRQQAIWYLKSYFPKNFIHAGGQREEKLSFNNYAKLIRTSRIGINFPISLAQFWQTKGRIFEVLASNSLLLEFKNPSTASLFEAGKDYVEFTDVKDLIEKVKYYIEHEDERKIIAQHGHETYLSKYTSFHYWQRIMDYINNDLNKNNQIVSNN